MIGKDRALPTTTPIRGPTTGAKPVVAAIPEDVGPLDAAAREVAKVTTALEDPLVAEDWVARRELGERLALAQSTLENARSTAVEAAACRWVLLEEGGGCELPAGRGSAALSAAADLAYTSTLAGSQRDAQPLRPDVTGGQGAARVADGHDRGRIRARPGVVGIRSRGGHVQGVPGANRVCTPPDSRGNTGFRAPSDPQLQPAWDAFAAQLDRAKRRRVNLDDVIAALRSPPIGMKAGPVTVFVTAGLLARADDVALYEHGTFKPLLTADVSERMVRNPGHFDLKCFANTTGARRKVIEALATRLGVEPLRARRRVANVVAVVSHLVARVRRLDNFTRRTGSLAGTTAGVRDLLLEATEPDDLLFRDLPSILDCPEVAPDARTYP